MRIMFRDHESKRGRDVATHPYPLKRISRKIRYVVHHSALFSLLSRSVCDSRHFPLLFLYLSQSRRISRLCLRNLIQTRRFFRAAARCVCMRVCVCVRIKIFTNISRNIRYCDIILSTDGLL